MRVVFCIILSSLVSFAQAPTPVISFEKTHHDFGSITQNQQVSHIFKLANTGAAPLQIIEVQSSCGCSHTVLSKTVLEPGESTSIEVHFDPTGMRGNIRKVLEIISNDPTNPKSRLTFGANVTSDIMPSTTVVFFSKLSRNATASSVIRLESGNGQPITITEATIPNAPYLTCTVQPEGNDIVLKLDVDGQQIPKEKTRGVDVLTVQTTNEKYPTLDFHIQWNTEPMNAEAGNS